LETGESGREGFRRPAAAILAAAAGIAALLASVVLFLFDPALSRLFPPCLLHETTGLYCPGCGSLRSLHQLLHGHLERAFSLNPFLVLSLPFLISAPFLRKWLYRAWVPWAAFAVLVVYGILRNIPIRPFSLLAPH
jgi:hypothetical protein